MYNYYIHIHINIYRPILYLCALFRRRLNNTTQKNERKLKQKDIHKKTKMKT